MQKLRKLSIMIAVDNILISDDIKEICFACNLKKCLGECCVAGDAGAPLEEHEISILEDDINQIKPYMTEAGIEVVQKNGVFEYDYDGEYVTPLVNGEECAFVVVENSISFCAIEKAWKDGKTEFQKPVSCHLYPIRLSNVGPDIAVNYHAWDVCKPALEEGKKTEVPLYKYLKNPLIRKFGTEWYEKLVDAIENKDQ